MSALWTLIDQCEFCQISDARPRNGNDFNPVILKIYRKSTKRIMRLFRSFLTFLSTPLFNMSENEPRGTDGSGNNYEMIIIMRS